MTSCFGTFVKFARRAKRRCVKKKTVGSPEVLRSVTSTDIATGKKTVSYVRVVGDKLIPA